jgi:hypothetical protein
MAQLHDIRGGTVPGETDRATRRRLLAIAGGGGAVAAGAVLTSGLVVVAGAAQIMSGLEGAWEAAFLQHTSPPGAPANRILHIFTGGGGVITQFGPIGARAADGSFSRLSFGAGSWAHSGGREFEYSYRYIRWLGDLTQTEQIVVWVRLTLEAGGNQWTGDWKRRDVDGTGAAVRTLEGPVQGNRLGVDSLA